MSDIVERLREENSMPPYYGVPKIQADAADEIARLRAQNAELLETMRSIAKTTGFWTDEEAGNYFSSLFFGAQAKARAAIAKVEGESNDC